MKFRIHRTIQYLPVFLFLLIGTTPGAFAEIASDPFLRGWSAYENRDFSTAIKYWLPLAENGNQDAQYLLGILFTNGFGVPVDFKEAGKGFRKSAGQGDVGAQYYLGIFMEAGKGHPRDFKQAGYWFKKAAEQGYPDAQYRLGKWYTEGKGGEQDFIFNRT